MTQLIKPNYGSWKTVLAPTNFVGGALTESIEVNLSYYYEYLIEGILVGTGASQSTEADEKLELQSSGVTQDIMGISNGLDGNVPFDIDWASNKISMNEGTATSLALAPRGGKFFSIHINSNFRYNQANIKADVGIWFADTTCGNKRQEGYGILKVGLNTIDGLKFSRTTYNYNPNSMIAIYGRTIL